MKKQFLFPTLLLLVVSVMSISSCSKEPISVKYGIDEMELCLQQDQYQSAHELTHVVQQSDLRAAVEAAGGKWDLSVIKSAKMSNFKVVVTTTGTNMNDIENISVYVKDDNATDDGTQVAYIGNIGDGVTEATLSLNGTDLKDFLSKDHFTLVFKVLNKVSGNAPVCITLKDATMDISVENK
jgi:hypothetical protein